MRSIQTQSNMSKTHAEMSSYGVDHITQGIGRLSNVVMEKAKGCWLYDVDNTRYLDFSAGIGVTNTGHCHPKVTKAAAAQIENMVHGQVNIFMHKKMIELIQKLLPLLPKSLDRVFFNNSGSDAVEAAIKLARQATKKPNIVAMSGSYHGRSIGTLFITSSKTVYGAGFGPLPPGGYFAPFPNCVKCKLPKEDGICCRSYEEGFEDFFQRYTSPEETAAIIIEPVLGEGGYIPPPPGFLTFLREFCDKKGILLIFDEVQTGFMRTGEMFAYQHEGVEPDILVMAKGLASGFPLSAIAASSELTKHQPPGSMGGTYSGNAVSCAASIATLDILSDPSFKKNVNERSKQLFDALFTLQKKFPQITDIRGKGLMIGIDFDDSPKGTATKIIQNALEQHMYILNCGTKNTIRMVPPLIVTEQECVCAMQMFEKALEKTFTS